MKLNPARMQFEKQPDPVVAAPATAHVAAAGPYAGARYEYKTEILTSVVGRDKLRLPDLDDALRRYGAEGWELVNLSLDADLKGSRDGHLLVFKRQVV